MRRLEFASLQVRDIEASKEFDTQKLGFEDSGMPNPHACVFRYNKGESSFAIRTPIGDLEGKELGVGVAIWFAIDGKIGDLQAQLLAKDIILLGPIQETSFGKIIVAKDPDGYSLTFLETVK